MAVRNSKDVAYVALTVLSVLLVAAQCEDATPVTNTKSSNSASSPGLDRIKLLPSLEKENSPAVQLNERKNPNEKMEEEEKQMHKEEESEKLTNIQDDNSMAANDENVKKAGSPAAKTRSNSSSSAESIKLHSSTHPLFADRHQGDASETTDLVNRNSNSSSEIMHEHVVRYQLHQSSEEDSEEDSSFKAPASGGAHGKVSDSVVVSSDSFPVRLAPNSKTPGSSNNNNNRVLAIRKPLPIVRQEAAQSHVSDSFDNIHDRFLL